MLLQNSLTLTSDAVSEHCDSETSESPRRRWCTVAPTVEASKKQTVAVWQRIVFMVRLFWTKGTG